MKKEDDPELQNRLKGLQHFLDYVLKHNQLCANANLDVFLTKEGSKFEEVRQRSPDSEYADLNQKLAEVLLDGSPFLRELSVSGDGGYVGSAFKVVNVAGTGLQKMGGLVSGALWKGAGILGLAAENESNAQ